MGAREPACHRLSLVSGAWSIARLSADAPIPAWATAPDWFSVTRTPDELSVVGPADRVPPEVQSEGPWAMFRVEGPLAFSETGVIAGLSRVLADASVSVFVVSTFDTDYVLVPAGDLAMAQAALVRAGYGWEEGRVAP